MANLQFNEVKAELSKAHFFRVIIFTYMFYVWLQNTIVVSGGIKTEKRNSFPLESYFTYTHIKLQHFRILINTPFCSFTSSRYTFVFLPHTVYLFSKYSSVHSLLLLQASYAIQVHTDHLGESLISCFISETFIIIFFWAALMKDRDRLDLEVQCDVDFYRQWNIQWTWLF